MRKDVQKLTAIVKALDSFLETKESLETAFGPQSTSAGYVLQSIENLNNPRSCLLSIYLKDRAKREKDEIRNGDLVYLRYSNDTGKIELCF